MSRESELDATMRALIHKSVRNGPLTPAEEREYLYAVMERSRLLTPERRRDKRCAC